MLVDQEPEINAFLMLRRKNACITVRFNATTILPEEVLFKAWLEMFLALKVITLKAGELML